MPTTTNYFDNQGRLDYSWTTGNSDGSALLIDYDQEGNLGWTTITNTYSALGALYRQDIRYDDGSSTSYQLDYSNQSSHLYQVQYFSSAG